MSSTFLARIAIAGLMGLLGTALGCGGNSPSGPSEVTIPAATAVLPPFVTFVSPSTGSTAGDTPVTITGTGFQPGASVTFDGLSPPWNPWVRSSTSIQVTTPAHAAGAVDVVVTNPDGQASTFSVTARYTYASPASFDFNGTWEGGAGPEEWEYPIRFTIQNNILASVSCGTSGTVTFSPVPSISNGGFSFSGNDGVSISGRLVAASAATGRINLPPCTTTGWYATKQ